MSQPVLTVVIMAFNEGATVEGTIEDTIETCEAIAVPYELLVIDDGSTDSTPAVARRLAAQYPAIRIVTHGRNSGLGAVYRSGFDLAQGEWVTFLPADGQYPASNIPRMFAAAQGVDAAVGYATARRDGILPRVLSGVERLLYRLVIGQMPRFQGLILFRRALLERLPLTSRGRGWGIVMELILRLHRGGYRLVEVPNEVRPRTHGRSKVMNPRTIFANLRQLVNLGWKLRHTRGGDRARQANAH